MSQQPAEISFRKGGWSSEVAILFWIASATIALHLFTSGRYGFHRDELATLDDARQLAWGYPSLRFSGDCHFQFLELR